ncbi:MAG: ATP-dependent DNA helicase RecG [Planctomycetia bacterium]|nr:ATP-dependent DNA helicase RecG [Planctomycetia bacterium]
MKNTTDPIHELRKPIEFVKTVGRQRAELLDKMGIHTPADLLFWFPRDYEDFSNFTDLAHLVPDELQTICARVVNVSVRFISRGVLLTVTVEDGTQGLAEILFFNQAFRQKQIFPGQIYLFTGKPKIKSRRWQFTHPILRQLPPEEVEILNAHTVPGCQLGSVRISPENEMENSGELKDESLVGNEGLNKIIKTHLVSGLQPVYRLTEGLSAWEFRRMAGQVVENFAKYVEETFPEDFRERFHLLGITEAIRGIHFPENHERLEAARRRFIFQELFLLQLALGVRRRQNQVGFRAPIMEVTHKMDQRIRRLFPYELTEGQHRAISDITQDMAQGHPMNRLLQGDVGCGKTTVAVYAMLLAVAHGFQAVIMAPTEILARQHGRTLRKLLAHSDVRPVELVGGLRSEARQEILQKIASGDAKIIIGTHAVLQEDVKFENLGLVVIDEQHKFGVRQRASLRSAGESPHYLVMTATPIPRSVAMTLFGDLDITSIRELPPGRQKVHTYLAQESQKESWWQFFREKINEGRQGYVVVPLVDGGKMAEADEENTSESEEDSQMETKKEVANLLTTYEYLKNGPLAGIRVGMIHGRMSALEKDTVMMDFRTGEIQVLVSTSVIEVGVDVPNATLLTILSAERFGLAQLHQIRGRISRGKHPGYCCVFPTRDAPEVQQRLTIFTETTDGFQLADADFSFRGPGNLFGTQQHGLPPFRLADLERDRKVLLETRDAAEEILSHDPGLASPVLRRMRVQMLHRYGRVLDLGDVG